MQVLTEGHKYLLANFERTEGEANVGQSLQFIEKHPSAEDPTKLVTVNNGTTNEEVLAMLIDRIKYLNGKFPCKENSCCITHLEEGLMWLEKRTNDRIKRQVEGTNQK